MPKLKDDDTAPDAPKPLADARVSAKTGWDKATDVYKFVCVGCNEEKRSAKVLDGKCESCWGKS